MSNNGLTLPQLCTFTVLLSGLFYVCLTYGLCPLHFHSPPSPGTSSFLPPSRPACVPLAHTVFKSSLPSDGAVADLSAPSVSTLALMTLRHSRRIHASLLARQKFLFYRNRQRDGQPGLWTLPPFLGWITEATLMTSHLCPCAINHRSSRQEHSNWAKQRLGLNCPRSIGGI